jgi:UDP-N-acetylmuramate dehydrogenase
MLEIKENELLKNQTTFQIGGPAKYFVVVKNTNEIKEAIAWAKEKQVDYKVIGGGSNLLVADSGFDGLVIKCFGGEIAVKDEIMEVDGGVLLMKAVDETLAAGLSGLEWATGIPGTVGGAICNNAGAYGGEMSQSVAIVTVLIDGKIKELDNSDCGFGYRESSFKRGEIKGVILSVKLQLKKVSAEEIEATREKMKINLADRLLKMPEGGSVGSTFRNIVLSEEEIKGFKEKFPELPDRFVEYRKIPAAWLIEECGLKSRKIGGAMVSEKHAGKITNVGDATAEDVIMLISIVKQKVRSKFNLQLMEEMEYLGF